MGLSTPILIVPLINLILPLLIVVILPAFAKSTKSSKYLTTDTLNFVNAALIAYALIFGLIKPIAALAT